MFPVLFYLNVTVNKHSNKFFKMSSYALNATLSSKGVLFLEFTLRMQGFFFHCTTERHIVSMKLNGNYSIICIRKLHI